MQFEALDEFASSSLPVLYYDVLCSQARSCQMLIKLLRIDVELQPTDLIEDVHFDGTYTWLNSFCRVPTLVDGNVTLCNGHSILIYLCQKYASKNMPNLCPCDYITRQKLTSLLHYEGLILNRCLSNLVTELLLAKYPNFDVEYHKRKAYFAYKSLSAFLNGHSFMIGSRVSTWRFANHKRDIYATQLTIADISIVSTLSALNTIFPINNVSFSKLFDWFQRLKKMDFYQCNEQGLQKLRYLLKNIGNFNFPSTSNDVRESMDFSLDPLNHPNPTPTPTERYSVSNYSGNHQENKESINSTTSHVKSISQNMKKEECFSEQRNGEVEQHDTEKYQFYDTFFINVSNCDCCAFPAPHNRHPASHNQKQKGSNRAVREIYRRPDMSAQINAAENNFRRIEDPNAQHQSVCKIAKCFCNKRLNQIVEANDKNWKNPNGNELIKDVKNNRKESLAYEQSSSSNSDDTNEEISEEQDVLSDRDNSQGTETETCDKERKSSKVSERTSLDSANQTVCISQQKFLELMEKVRKYEQILEETDKVLKNKEPIVTKTFSNSSSMHSVQEEQKEENCFPAPCNVSNYIGQPSRYRHCRCHNKISEKRRRRIEALEFDVDIPIVLPKFLVAKSENQSETVNLTSQSETEKLSKDEVDNQLSLKGNVRSSEEL